MKQLIKDITDLVDATERIRRKVRRFVDEILITTMFILSRLTTGECCEFNKFRLSEHAKDMIDRLSRNGVAKVEETAYTVKVCRISDVDRFVEVLWGIYSYYRSEIAEILRCT